VSDPHEFSSRIIAALTLKGENLGGLMQGHMQRGAQENLWPKSFLERPVARHFVCSICLHTACHWVSRT
jgi:hypothetical protein